MRLIATIICIAGIIGLFYLDRDRKLRTSKALWIPLIWLMIHCSRPVSAWINGGVISSVTSLEVYTEGSPIDAAAHGILIVAGLLILSLRLRQVGRFLRGNTALLLFFAYCALSIAWSDQPLVALKRWIKEVGDIAMVLVILTDLNPQAAIKWVFSRTAFVLLPLSVLFIRYYGAIGRGYSRDWGVFAIGVTTFKNELGAICLVFGLVSLWSFVATYKNRLTPHRSRHLAARGSIVFLAVVLCKVADSMTSLACFLISGAIVVLTSRKWFIKRPRSVLALVCGCVILALFALFFDESGTMVHALGRQTNLTGRTDIWKAILSIHTNPLVGSGFESFWMGSRIQQLNDMLQTKGLQEAHNGYLEVYLNLGLAGIALLGNVIVTGYRKSLTVFRQDPDGGGIRLALLTAVVIYCLTEAGFRIMGPIWFIFLVAVTFVPSSLRSKERQPAAESPDAQWQDELREGHAIEESPQLVYND